MGGHQNLIRRLSHGGRSTEPCEYLQDDPFPGGQPLPAWVDAFTDVLTANLARSRSFEPDRAADPIFAPDRPLPFETVLLGFLDVARDRAARECGASLTILGASAQRDQERGLLKHLAFLAGLALGRDFSEYRFGVAPGSAFTDVWAVTADSKELYVAFTQKVVEDGMLAFFERYPVLARLMSTSVLDWATGLAELCSRLDADLPGLAAAALAPTGSACWVAHLGPDLSDRHSGGRTVTLVEFSTGDRLVYKPRSIAPERAFFHLVEIVNREFDPPLPLMSVATVGRTSHGWMEFVSSHECESGEERRRFGFRSGMVLCLLRTLAVSDIHYENLLRAGDQPVVVDLELILDVPPRSRSSEDTSPLRSVVDTGMLPQVQDASSDANLSALGARRPPIGPRRPRWRHLNTDRMILVVEDDAASDDVTADPYADGHAEAYVEAVSEGFAWMYRALERHRERLVADSRMIELLDSCTPRILVRNTATYADLHLHTVHPEYLAHGLDRSIELEWLARPLSTPELLDHRMPEVLRREVEAMERLDVPRFGADEPDVSHPSAPSEFADLFGRRRDGAAFVANVNALDAADLDQQLRLIAESLGSEAQGDAAAGEEI